MRPPFEFLEICRNKVNNLITVVGLVHNVTAASVISVYTNINDVVAVSRSICCKKNIVQMDSKLSKSQMTNIFINFTKKQ